MIAMTLSLLEYDISCHATYVLAITFFPHPILLCCLKFTGRVIKILFRPRRVGSVAE